ncbi:ficolin-1 [Drosophila bipectinata]|uniref:ficolin-1 n=1 Tax=Drosophila bipectinata TaxID=42026 RepID=UPI0038B399B3
MKHSGLAFYFLLIIGVESLNVVEELESIYEMSELLISSLKKEAQALTPAQVYPTSCLSSGEAGDQVTVKVPGQSPFPVFCDNQLAGPGWLVIQRRLNGSLSFFRHWEEYKEGFGSLEGEFFLGLEKIRGLTALEPHELYVHLEDFQGTKKHAKFDEFAIGSAEDDYAMNVLGKYSGTAGDSLRSHRKMKFSTYDRDNDKEFNKNCAFYYLGGWWYNACLDSNLNGQYVPGGQYEEKLFARGMCWRSWRGHNYGYKITQMMIRPKCRNVPVPVPVTQT